MYLLSGRSHIQQPRTPTQSTSGLSWLLAAGSVLTEATRIWIHSLAPITHNEDLKNWRPRKAPRWAGPLELHRRHLPFLIQLWKGLLSPGLHTGLSPKIQGLQESSPLKNKAPNHSLRIQMQTRGLTRLTLWLTQGHVAGQMTEQPETRAWAPQSGAVLSLWPLTLPGGEHPLTAKCLANSCRKGFSMQSQVKEEGMGSEAHWGQ